MILQMQSRQVNDINVVELKGRLTLGNSLRDAEDSIRKQLGAGPAKTVLDLTELDFVDSAGIGMLIICNSTAEGAGGKLRIAGAGDRVRQAFEITHVDQVLALYATLDEALAGW